MRCVVGYTATERGRDALNLACAIARSRGAELDLVMVEPESSPYTAVYPPETGFHDLLGEQLQAWLGAALAMVPADVTARGHIRRADSDARGLIDAALEFDAGLIVVGAARNGLFKRFTVGSVANALLHAAPVPVALAPLGYNRTAAFTRITCAVGDRPGIDDVLDEGVRSAVRAKLPLRLVSLVELDEPSGQGGVLEQTRLHVKERMSNAVALAAGKTEVSMAVAHGRTIENAIDEMDFDDGEILVIGSSRLAEHNRLFLGATAAKVLRSLPIPMVVVPRSDTADGTAAASGAVL